MARRVAWGCAVMMSASAVGCASGDRYAGMPGPGEYDRTFLSHAYEAAMAQSVVAQAAEQRGHVEAVKRVARTVAADERRLMSEIYNLSQDKGVPLPNAPGHDGQALARDLEQAPDTKFDRAFVKAAGRWAQREAALYQDAAERAGDPDLRALARRSLPGARERARTICGLASAG